MKTSSTATGSENNVSGDMWFSKGTNLKETMFIFSSVVNKKIIVPVALLFRCTLCLPIISDVKFSRTEIATTEERFKVE
jgi:hypothetical protein